MELDHHLSQPLSREQTLVLSEKQQQRVLSAATVLTTEKVWSELTDGCRAAAPHTGADHRQQPRPTRVLVAPGRRRIRRRGADGPPWRAHPRPLPRSLRQHTLSGVRASISVLQQLLATAVRVLAGEPCMAESVDPHPLQWTASKAGLLKPLPKTA